MSQRIKHQFKRDSLMFCMWFTYFIILFWSMKFVKSSKSCVRTILRSDIDNLSNENET